MLVTSQEWTQIEVLMFTGGAQQTRTRDFMCSVSEFTSSTGSIHGNSPDSVDKFGVSIRVSREITSFFT